ncbi:MAG: hypothetical protein P8K08_02190 [Fuerstiella sp.]|nr:hypothetical protein [Fuerstiella sp.]
MSTATPSTKISELVRAVRKARDDAFLVEARVVRRIIRELYGFARLSTRIPHTDVLVVRFSDVRALAHPDELGLNDFTDLPRLVILVAQPEEHELEELQLQALLQLMWGRLFHGCIDLQLLREQETGLLARADVHRLIDRIGQVEFDEAHAVLRSELRLIHTESHTEAYCEFAAIYLQLTMFSPDLLPVWFPSLAETSHVLPIISKHIDPDKLFLETQLYGAAQPDLTSGTMRDEVRVASERQSWTEGIQLKPSSGRYARLMKKRDRWNERGNTVAAAVSAARALEAATTGEDTQAAENAARADTEQLAERLHEALSFDTADLDDWRSSLWELLKNATHGFWNSDKRLLYDLQKVCLDHELTVYHVDLVKWIVSRGKRPLRRPLNSLREVMMAKHLASSASRLVYVRLSGAERERLSHLLHEAAGLAEQQMRQRMRSAIQDTIVDVGLHPQSVPEQVAFDKMVEESLDCIAERGYLTMGYLRDAISRNDLKLPDLTDPKDLIRGDHLLRSDDRLDVSLDGVYRRGEFYLRWLQIISSLAFGTRTGRFATLFLAIPFGGAVVIVVAAHHILAVATRALRKRTDAARNSTDAGSREDDAAASGVLVETAETTNGSNGGMDRELAELERRPQESDDATSSQGDSEANNSNATAAAGKRSAADTSPSVPSDTAFGGTDALTEFAADEQQAALTESTIATTESPQHHAELTFAQALPPVMLIGFMLMALVHVPALRNMFGNVLRSIWRVLRTVTYDIPVRLLSLPIVKRMWRSRWFVRLRRNIATPALLAWFGCRIVPWLLLRPLLDWWWVGTVAVLLSLAVNSRLGRDAEELTAEWLANAWYDLRARFLVALLDWVIDFFKWLLNVLERFIYAVDEWLRFHSGETWLTVVLKAFLGVIWSFLAFLLRIYVNLLIEPTLNPLKHFPVVTVAHKIFLPVILVLEQYMRNALTPYLGIALAGPITWFNIVFLPGIFGFLVWELKENWRLYATNRVPWLQPVAIGSHGETGGRLLKPGFHSGTLPKLFHQLRQLERKEASFDRFSRRRAVRESIQHCERDIRRFVDRDLVRLLTYCSVWSESPILCRRVRAASNSFLVELWCNKCSDQPLQLLFQEQSGWLVATVADQGWLSQITPEMVHSFETALRGFYAKTGVNLVREQMERNLIGPHPYDVGDSGLVVWPDRQFDREIHVDLHRRHKIRPTPVSMSASYGLQPASREAIVFAESRTRWTEWQQVWTTPIDSETSAPLPLACMQSAQVCLLSPIHD